MAIDISKYFTFLLPIFIWFGIQGIKIILFSLKHGWNLRNTLTHVGYGHMPSAHTGFVCSMITAVGYYDGAETGAFAVAVILAIMTIDDSVRLRMYIGDQGIYLNRMAEHMNLTEKEFPKLKERMGHKISEVIVGGLLGVALTLALAKILEAYPIGILNIF